MSIGSRCALKFLDTAISYAINSNLPRGLVKDARDLQKKIMAKLSEVEVLK